MLASDTQGIADYLKQVMVQHYQLNEDTLKLHFADTRDTLCYATNDNQMAVSGMLLNTADFALVIGGYNSSNTSHLVELCELQLPTFLINNENCLSLAAAEIIVQHFDIHTQQEKQSTINLNSLSSPSRVMVTSGASCPDALVERVIHKLTTLFGEQQAFEFVKEHYALA
jgi:4-hydroxy-3-methylbut-2-enyl diphosphate reductase